MYTDKEGNGADVAGPTGRGGGGRGVEVALRLAAVALAVTAAVMMGVNKERKTVAVTLIPGLPIYVPVTAKSSYQSAFVYLIVANSIASVVATLTLILTLARPRGLTILKAMCDVMVVALLFSATGAAGAVGLLGQNGNRHVMWNKVCDNFGRFCHVVLGSIVVSFFGSIVFVALVLLAFHSLRRN